MTLSCVAALCMAGPGLAAPSIAAFAADADFASPSLSPDGKKISFVTRYQGARVLMVLDLEKKESRAIMLAVVDTFEATWCRFKTDDWLLCGFTGTQFEGGQPYHVSRLVGVDASGKGKPRVLIQNGKRGSSQYQDRILGWLRNDPDHVLIELDQESSVYPAVFALDVRTGSLHMVQRERTPILDWHADRDGVVRFGYGYDDTKSTYITRDSTEGGWRTLAKWELGEDDFDVVDFGFEPETLLVSANLGGRDAIFEMDLDEKKGRELLLANNEVDIGSPIYWPADGRLVGFSYETDRENRKLFDTEAERIYAAIDKVMPGAENRIIGSSRDGKILLIASNTDVRPMQYYLLDLNDTTMRHVGDANPALSGAALAPMKAVKIKGPDGVMLPGYLTLPVGSPGKNLPMIVYPHGGPYYRDSWGYDFMVQFMASRGFAVLQVNFRGSTGYGYEWYEAGLRNWGTVMVDDISASTRWAIAEGIADPRHTCIVGWSYGGYAALMSAVREPDLYKCVVSIAGVSDLRGLTLETRRFYGGRFRAKYSIGSDYDELKAGSPLRAPEKIRAPILMVHGDDDTQVLVDHSRRMARALDREKKKYELVVIKDGNHALSRYEWRETLLTKLENFLAENR